MVQELSLGIENAVLVTHTSIEPLDGKPLTGVCMGARIDWGGASPFVPGMGTLGDAGWHQGDFIGNTGHATSTVFGFQGCPLQARATHDWRGHTAFLSHTDTV